jgi:hypothetical protein
LRAAALAVTAFAAATANAQSAPPANADWGVSAGALHRRLVERAEDGRRLVEESGPVLRLAVDGRLRLPGGGALRMSAGAAGGDLDYDGQTQAGMPLRSESRHRDLDFSVAWRPWAEARWGQAWLVLRGLDQRRRIASTPAASGLRETSMLLSVGARWAHAFDAAGWQWQPSIELRTSVRHRLEVDFGGVFDTADIQGARRREVVLGLDVSAPGSPWSGGIAWTHARQPASARATLFRGGVPVGTVHQPRIEIDDFSLQARRVF